MHLELSWIEHGPPTPGVASSNLVRCIFCIQNPKDLVMRELMLCEIHGLDLEEMEWNKEI